MSNTHSRRRSRRSAAALAALLWLAASSAAARDLRASLGRVTGLIESTDAGPFVELIRAIDEVYTAGQIERQLFPFIRSVENVSAGRVDFHVPMLRNPRVPASELPYRIAAERLGVVEFVLYSRASAHPITAERVREGLRNPGGFPYQIDVLRGTAEGFVEFPVNYANDVEQGMLKVLNSRSDAFLTPQEEGDEMVRKLRLKGLHRSLYQGFDDVILLPKGPQSDSIDAILSQAIRTLKASGRWSPLYEKVHRPYDDWQPAQQPDW